MIYHDIGDTGIVT